MPKSRTNTRKIPPSCLTDTDILKDLVLPALMREEDPVDGESAIELVEDDPRFDGRNVIYSCLRSNHIVHASALQIDEIRFTVQLSLMTGYLIMNTASDDAMMVGALLHPTPFHVRTDADLGKYGRLCVDCDITVRADDGPLLEHRLSELLQLAEDLRWYFPLRMPQHLCWDDLLDMEMDWAELPHEDLFSFFEVGMEAPKAERTPITLLRLAQGLDRWRDVLRLLQDHPRELPRKSWAPLKAIACCQLERWMPAIRAAKVGGIRNGRYPGEESLNPTYLYALIMGGDEIEALRLLGEPEHGEPAYYDWLRAIALRQAGDYDNAFLALLQYMRAYPGDVLGCHACRDVIPETDD